MFRAVRDSSPCATWLPIRSSSLGAFSSRFLATPVQPLWCEVRQSGQTSTGEVARRDLRAELLVAEEEARNKKRKAEGRPPVALAITAGTDGVEDEDTIKRRKLLQEALELDKDDDEEDDGDEKMENEESEEESEDEDDTDELLRELEKIKRERAEDKARQEREQLASEAAQLDQSRGLNTTVPGTFSVKRRWDDGTCLSSACSLSPRRNACFF